jgi:DNA-directed RNA polymerase beta' subunit
VKYIQTFLPSGSHIRGTSVLAVETVNDLLDTRLGVVDWGQSCATCKSFLEQCPGHPGHLELPIPIYRVFFTRQLLTTLNVVCFHCRALRVPRTDPVVRRLHTLPPKERLSFLGAHSRQKLCHTCVDTTGAPLPHVVFRFSSRDNVDIEATVPLTDHDKALFTEHGTEPACIGPADIFEHLSAIPADVKELLGCGDWNDPSALMWDVLPIPSMNTRPRHTFAGIGTGGKQVHYNDWTKVLRTIVTARNDLAELLADSSDRINICTYTYNGVSSRDPRDCFGAVAATAAGATAAGATTGAVAAAWHRLNQCVAAFHSFRHKKYVNKNSVFSRPLLNVEDRFKYQKSGRFRGNITARRVNNALRGVLEGDIHLHPDEVGIPRSEAMTLGRKIHVNALNMQQVGRWVANGPLVYPGANYATLRTGEEIDLRHHEDRRRLDLRSLQSVHRHLLDGDVVMVNRQPTLHKPSMMTFRVRVIDGAAIRLHYAVFTPMAADCDGDEVNVHVPQTLAAIAEISLLSRVHDCIMKDGVVWIKFIQNAVVGAYLLTRDSTLLDQDDVHDLTEFLGLWAYPDPVDPGPRWHGRQLVSLLLPDDFSLELRLESGTVRIVNGQLLEGQLSATALNGRGGLLEHLYRDYGDPDIAVRFLYNGYRLFQAYLDHFGLSAGYYDCTVEDPDVLAALGQVREKAAELGRHLDRVPAGEDVDTELRHHNEAAIGTARQLVVGYHRRRDRRHDANGVLQIVDSGAKGSTNVLNQMCGMIGQVYVLHERYAPRTSHFRPGRDSLRAHGFVGDCYSSGVGLHGIIAESHAACESVLNKNRGTAKSGYTMRKLTTCMMGVVVDYTNTVVDTTGRVLWGRYGNDGYDPARLTHSAVRLLALAPAEIEQSYTLRTAVAADRAAVEDEVREMLALRHEFLDQTARAGMPYTATHKCSSPVDFGHLVLRTLHRAGRSGVVCTPAECGAGTRALWDRLVRVDRVVETGHALFRLLYLDWLSVRRVVGEHQLGLDDLAYLGEQLATACRRARVAPGESVGVNATQCLGEPFTQLSLKNPHLSGKFNTVSGAVRIANLVDGICPDPSMCVVLSRAVRTRSQAARVGTWLAGVSVSHLVDTFPVVTVDAQACTVVLELQRARCCARFISPRTLYRRLCVQFGLSLDSGSASMADDPVWRVRLGVPLDSTLWLNIASLLGDGCTGQSVGLCIALNLWQHTLVMGSSSITNFLVEEREFAGADGCADTRWTLSTLGSDLVHVLAHPLVDRGLTTSSDCAEVGAVFGLQAARKALETQMSTAMSGMADTRHIKLIARMMASNTVVQGMKVSQTGRNIPPLQRAAYEQPAQQMSEYCAAAERDYSHTICGAALTNTPMRVGTGYGMELLPAGVQRVAAVRPGVCRYVCSPKVDGTRALLVFATCQTGLLLCNLVDRRGSVWSLPVTGLTPSTLFCGTVLDGDVTLDRGGLACFVVFDCLLSCGHVTSAMMYGKRLEIGREVVYRMGTCDGTEPLSSSNEYRPIRMQNESAVPSRRPGVSTHSFRPGTLPFHLCVKPVFDVQDVCRIDCGAFQFPTDGFVFTDNVAPATPFRVCATSVLKWKPVSGLWDENTVDMVCGRVGAGLEDRRDIPGRFTAYRVRSGGYTLSEHASSGSPFSHGEDTLGIYSGVGVYECRWHRVDAAWHLYRARDKAANTLETVLSTIDTIIDSVRLIEIQRCVGF